MTPEEQKMIADLFERIRSTSANARDSQAEAFINDNVRATPYAPYVLAQTVLVQNQALEAASRRIADLEAAAQANAPAEGGFLGHLGKSLFGGGAPVPQRSNYDAGAYQRASASPPPSYSAPQPQAYAPPPPSGPWGAPAGGGFLHNAMSTAAGVAGGIALGNIIGGLFGGHGGGLFGGGFPGGLPGGGEVINNFYEGGPGRGQDMRQIDALQDSQQDALSDADATQDALQDAQDSGFDSFDGGGGTDT